MAMQSTLGRGRCEPTGPVEESGQCRAPLDRREAMIAAFMHAIAEATHDTILPAPGAALGNPRWRVDQNAIWLIERLGVETPLEAQNSVVGSLKRPSGRPSFGNERNPEARVHASCRWRHDAR
jgi:hypothetical protein